MSAKLNERKLKILKSLLERGFVSVAELQRVTGIPRSSLNHHLYILTRDGYIRQKRKGKELLCSVEPIYIQRLRVKLGMNAPKALISGYTFHPNNPDTRTLRVVERAVNLLKKEGVNIDRTIAFTTPLARGKIREEGVMHGDEEIEFEIEVYQNDINKIKKRMKKVIEKNLLNYELIVDLTPLTKLYTIVALSFAKEYGVKAIYHAGKKLIWILR